ncbi:MAG: N-acyl homoserine lactonase family protein [Dehalococcoidia bacterium]
MADETYRIFAVRYAMREATRKDHFLGGDPDGDRPMPMDYFVWAVVNDARTVVVDTGFTAPVAAKRGRTHLRQPAEALALVGVDAGTVEDVVITHLHYDHVGTISDFPQARFHLQERELAFATGRPMLDDGIRHSFEEADILSIVEGLHRGRVVLHDGADELAPGISLHLIGGHTGGNQVVRVRTERGWVVLASDASHYYENMESDRPFTVAYEPERVRAGFRALRALADSPRHVIPGHDPLVLQRYPAPSADLEGIAVRLDLPPGD